MTPTPTPKPKFRDSAAVVLVRGGADALEVFWVLRSDAVSYMPGFRAFPGGTVLPEDETLPIDGAFDERERLLRACLVREAFEETGVLLALATPHDPAALPGARRRLLAGAATFPELAREHGWTFHGDALEFCGRWRTPPFATAKFDTTFFLAHRPAGQEASVHPGELASGEWIAPADALQRWKHGDATFAAPILHMLYELERGGDDLAARMAEAPERTARGVRRIELQWGIVLHPMLTRPLPPATHTNAYLVGDRDLALIDPGSGDPDQIEALVTLIETLAADGRHVRLILVTHAHPDHIGGVEALRQRYGLQVAAHMEVAPLVRAERILQDGDVIKLATHGADWNLRAIHTPGHARGHLCFLHARTGTLFSGDHITGGAGTVIIDPPDGDMADYIASLERLATLPIRAIFPAHGSPQGAALRRIHGLITHRRAREAGVVAALETDPLPIQTLVERAYQDVKPELWPYAERSLLAHLIALEREGRVVRVGEEWKLGAAEAAPPAGGSP